jgi:hypothetical protein
MKTLALAVLCAAPSLVPASGVAPLEARVAAVVGGGGGPRGGGAGGAPPRRLPSVRARRATPARSTQRKPATSGTPP